MSDWVARIRAFWNPRLDALEDGARRKDHVMSKGEIIPESAVRFVRDFDAPPAKVWAFLTDSQRCCRNGMAKARSSRAKAARSA